MLERQICGSFCSKASVQSAQQELISVQLQLSRLHPELFCCMSSPKGLDGWPVIVEDSSHSFPAAETRVCVVSSFLQMPSRATAKKDPAAGS